jgi:hypothetical protein
MSEVEISTEYGAPPRGTRPRASRLRTPTVLEATGGVALVVFLLTAATAGAAPVAAAGTHTAPYAGQANQAVFWSNQGCGTSFALKKLPEFNLTTGRFVASESARSKTCGSSGSSLFGEVEGSYGSPQFAVSNGTYSVGVHWKVVDSIALAAVSGAGGITAGSYVIVGAYAELEDVTNGSTWQFGNESTYYANSTSATSEGYDYALHFSGRYHLVAGQEYEIVTGVYAEVNTFVNGAKSSASASVNLGTSGDRATMTSITYP